MTEVHVPQDSLQGDDLEQNLTVMEEKPSLLVGRVDDQYPEGGWKAWGVAAGTSLTLFCSLGYVNSFG